ncbi:hypothetical protein ACGFNU_44070 [Spirillospora sp. NPDC048911]|uniref:hypothetical protein n=1 Tax=Spirillospora sp. NPDC048911 TaxID=3364527 RepID=UPI00372152AE
MFTVLVSADDRIGFNAESTSSHQLPPPTRAGGLLNAAGDKLDSLTLTTRAAESRDRYLLCSTALDASIDDQSKYRILSATLIPR